MITKSNVLKRTDSPQTRMRIGLAIGAAVILLAGCATPTSTPAGLAPQADTKVKSVSETQSVVETRSLTESKSVTEAKSATVAQPQAISCTPSPAEIEEKWGIRLLGLRLSAAGYLLDFRYRVVDPEKAATIFSRAEKPYLIDQATGRKVVVPNPPKVGPLRNSDTPQANRNYFTMFANPGTFIRSGNKVTIVVGDFRVENLVVQ